MARRVSKPPEVRRDELLDIAMRLCAARGFDRLAVEQITTEAGVAKGTFYYYFASKDDLLLQLARRFGDDLFAHLERECAGFEGTGLAGLRHLMDAASAHKMAEMDAHVGVLPFLYRPENALLRASLFNEWFDRTLPWLEAYVTRGAADGSFDVADPEMAARLVLTVWIDGAERMWRRALDILDEDTFVDVLSRSVTAIAQVHERILGAAPGSLALPVSPDVYRGVREPFQAAAHPTGPPQPHRRSS